jgi:mono/diheme cytochrome c family protein
MMRSGINIVLFLALAFVTLMTWMLRRDFTQRNHELLPGMLQSVPYDAFSPNPNFTDGKTLQTPPAGTLARSVVPLHYAATSDDALRAGRELVNPLSSEVAADVDRGRMVYATFCQPCHGSGGKGDGLITLHGFPPPPSLLAENAMKLPDGTIFHLITYGRGNMPSLASQIEPMDRCRAVLGVRSLQATQRIAAGK